MLKITQKTLQNQIIITILFVYIYFYQNRFSKNFNLPQGGICKYSESSQIGNSRGSIRGSRCLVSDTGQAKSDGSLWGHRAVVFQVFVTTHWNLLIISNGHCILLLSPVQHFTMLHCVWSLYILKLCVELKTMSFVLLFYVISQKLLYIKNCHLGTSYLTFFL